MSLLFSLLLKMDAGQAKTELRALQTEMTKAGGTAKVLGDGVGFAGEAADAMAAEIAALKAQIEALIAAQSKGKTTTEQFKRSTQGAASSMGNLVAQFNDVGMMIMAGQNPLQLAIQQGTQITQVIGPMGAAGAVKALGGALLSMLNPLNLVTLGVIAGGAAIVQWATAADDATAGAGRLASAYENLSAASVSVQSKIDKLRFGVDEDFQVELLREQIRLQAEFNAKKAELAGYEATTTDGIDRQRISTEALRAEISGIADKYNANAALLAEQVNRSTTLAVIEGQRAQAAAEIAAQLRDGEAVAARQLLLASAVYQVYADTRSDSAADLSKNEELLGKLQQEAQIRQLINEYGAGSAQVAQARAAAERDAFLETLSASEASAALKDQLIEAYDAANGLAGVDMASGIGNAASAAQRLASWLSISVSTASKLSALGPQGNPNDPSGKVYGGRGSAPSQVEIVEMRTGYITPPKLSTASGSGGGAAKAEADAVAELITKLREEQEVLAETDPVKQELLKYRKQLADATAAERAEVEDLIRAEQQLKAIREAEDFAAQSATDFLDAIIVKGESAEDTLKSLLSSLIKVGIQALMLGEGPLAGILGINGGLFSGLFGGPGAAALATGGDAAPSRISAPARLAGRKAIRAGDVAGFADAARRRPIRGLITGDGGPRDDRVPAWLSPGEYIVNGQATARYRPVLERMNAGADIAGYASGGMIGASRGAGNGRARGRGRAGVVGDIHIHGASGDAQIREMVAQGIRAGLTAYDRDVLPTRVPGILRDPRAR